MFSSLELPIFDTIAGLPVHILVVHLAVVLLPVAAVGQALLVFVPAWRARWATPTLAGLVIGTGAAFVAEQSGEALAAHVGTPRTHAFWGDILPPVAAVLLIVAAVWWYLQRRQVAGTRGVGAPSVTLPTLVAGLLSAVLAVAAAGITVAVGHSGAQAAWGGRIDGAAPSASVAPASSTTSSSTKSATTTTPSASATTTTPSASATTTTSAALTLAAVKQHNTSSNCWSIINGNVYDLTAWINQHPGGPSVIKALCGTDGTASFEGQHGGSSRVASDLATFKKGALVG